MSTRRVGPGNLSTSKQPDSFSWQADSDIHWHCTCKQWVMRNTIPACTVLFRQVNNDSLCLWPGPCSLTLVRRCQTVYGRCVGIWTMRPLGLHVRLGRSARFSRTFRPMFADVPPVFRGRSARFSGTFWSFFYRNSVACRYHHQKNMKE